MNDEIPVFSSKLFGNIHAFEENGMVYFYGAEVAEILGYENVFVVSATFWQRWFLRSRLLYS